MKRILSFALAASLLAFIIILAADTSSAQTTGTDQKATNRVKAANQEKVANQGKVGREGKWGAFDDDGDGIVNCQDPDYVPPRDGTGKKLGKMHGGKGMYGYRGGYQQGSGAGTGGAGTGVCDGTGPKGKGRGR